MIKAYYNEIDPHAAAWLRQLIKNGDITQGVVDERSIVEVEPNDIKGFDRVHWFAGIGTWDYVLNRAGWGNRPIWTASLPCQPFSAAGKGLGKSDERHLLPHYFDLVRKCRPDVQIGEQVERAITHGWLDDLQANMETEGYAIGHCVLGAHSVNAAHIRQRLYWVANTDGEQKHTPAETGLHPQFGGDCVEWLYCADNKYRPIKSGIPPLVDGAARELVCGSDTSQAINANATQEARNMRLKGYGNAIQVDTAMEFTRAVINVLTN